MYSVFLPGIVIYLISSAGGSFLNRAMISAFHVNYITTLACFHFFFIYCACEGFIWVGLVKRKQLAWRVAIPMSFAWCCSVVFSILSFSMDSQGYYEALRLLVLPVLVVCQHIWLGIKTEKGERWALCCLFLGMELVTISDFHPSLLGSIYGILQVLFTAAVQCCVWSKQKVNNLNPAQLLYSTALVCFLLLLPTATFIDSLIMVKDQTPRESISFVYVLTAFGSGLMALLINLSCFLLIGHKNPIVFQVIRCFKVLVMSVIGCLFFNDSLSLRKLAGICITGMSLSWYAWSTRLTAAKDRPDSSLYTKLQEDATKAVELLTLEEEAEVDEIMQGLSEGSPDTDFGSVQF